MISPALYALALLALEPAAAQQNWSTYPHVPKTASINGFADPIYGKLPVCAQKCVELSVNNTPCPYWDTGCICIMPQWVDPVADCFAQNCKGQDVAVASFLAESMCKTVGAWWNINASATRDLANAGGNTVSATYSSGVLSSRPSSSAATAAASESASATASSPTASATSAKASSSNKKSKNGAGVAAVGVGAVAAVIANLL